MFNQHTFLLLSTLLNVLSAGAYWWYQNYNMAWYMASAASLNLSLLSR